MTTPQKENGHIKIATGSPDNDVLSALIHAGLTGAEYQIALVVLRKTWGFNKKEDWIALSQFQAESGRSRSYVCRAIIHLVGKHILVTRKSPQKTFYSFNKLFAEWVVTTTSLVTTTSPELVTSPSPTSDVEDNQLVTPTSHTKAITTKAILQKQGAEEKTQSIADVHDPFMRIAIDVSDEHYAAKTWEQALNVPGEYQDRLLKKINVMLNSRRPAFTKTMFREIAGYVNDFGDMARLRGSTSLSEEQE